MRKLVDFVRSSDKTETTEVKIFVCTIFKVFMIITFIFTTGDEFVILLDKVWTYMYEYILEQADQYTDLDKAINILPNV